MKRIFLLADLCLAFGLTAPRILFAESGLVFDQTQGTLYGQLNVPTTTAAGLRVSSSAYLAVSGGNVGIGTDNPSYKLDIGGFVPTDQTLRLAAASGYNTTLRLMEAGDENGASLKYDGTNNRFGIFGHNASSAGVEYFTILRDAGYVGIGTTAPSHKLEVAGAVNLTGASSAYRLSSWDVASWDGGSGLRLGGPTGTWTYTSLYTNGTEKARIDVNGNVGIGTTGPTGKLSVFNSNGSDVDFLHANSGTFPKVTAIGLGSDAVSYDHTSAGATLNVKGSAQIAALQSAASNAPTDMAFYTTAGGNVGERMRITTGGNVGIGTTNPGAKLHVSDTTAGANYVVARFAGAGNNIDIVGNDGSGRTALVTPAVHGATGASGTLTLRNTDGNSNYAAVTVGNDINFLTPSASVATNRVIIQGTSGNVGIGTTGPEAPLDVRQTAVLGGTAGDTVRTFTTGTMGGTSGNNVYHNEWRLRDATGADWITHRVHDGLSVDASFWTPGTDTRTWWERDPQHDVQSWGHAALTYMTIAAGNVGIGTTGPGEKLEVSGGSVVIDNGQYFKARRNTSATAIGVLGFDSGTDNLFIRSGAATAAGGGTFFRNTSNVDMVAILNNGNVGIGITNPAAKLQIAKGTQTGTYANAMNGADMALYTGDGGQADTYVRFGGGTYSGASSVNLDLAALNKDYNKDGGWRLTGGSGTDNTVNNGYLAFSKLTFTGSAYSPSEAMRINSGGNVGVGTTAPGSILEVKAVTPVISINGTTGANFRGISFQQEGTETAIIKTETNGGELRLQTGMSDAWGGFQTFYTNNLERVRIASSGNVGIGTMNPGSMLEIKNSSNRSVDNYSPLSSDGNGANFIWSTDTTGSTKADIAYFGAVQDGAAQRSGKFYWQVSNAGAPGVVMTLNKAGNLGIGTTAPGEKLTVSGNVQVLGDRVRIAGGAVGTSATSLGININGSNGGGVALLLCSRNTSDGNNTGSAVYMLRYGYNGNNYGTQLIVGTDWVVFSIDGSGNLFASQSGGNATCSIITNK